MELSGDVRLGSGKGSAPEGGGHGPVMLELREHGDTAVSHRVWVVLCEAGGWTTGTCLEELHGIRPYKEEETKRESQCSSISSSRLRVSAFVLEV